MNQSRLLEHSNVQLLPGTCSTIQAWQLCPPPALDIVPAVGWCCSFSRDPECGCRGRRAREAPLPKKRNSVSIKKLKWSSKISGDQQRHLHTHKKFPPEGACFFCKRHRLCHCNQRSAQEEGHGRSSPLSTIPLKLLMNGR